MKPGKNLRDRLASQSGAPRSAGGGGPLSDGGLGKLIEADRVKRREAAENADAAGKIKPTATHPTRASGPKATGAAARGAGKSTTNQGLR